MACAIALFSRPFIERFSLLLSKQGNRLLREAATRELKEKLYGPLFTSNASC
jgi:hypothetical protein